MSFPGLSSGLGAVSQICQPVGMYSQSWLTTQQCLLARALQAPPAPSVQGRGWEDGVGMGNCHSILRPTVLMVPPPCSILPSLSIVTLSKKSLCVESHISHHFKNYGSAFLLCLPFKVSPAADKIRICTWWGKRPFICLLSQRCCSHTVLVSHR